MHIDVSDILRAEDGHHVDFAIDGESPDLEGVKLTAPLSGSVRIIRTPDGVLAAGELVAEVEQECSKCLRAFAHPLQLALEAEFSRQPEVDKDQFPIDKHGAIDLREPLRQEIELHLPLRPLCQDDGNEITLT